MNLRLPLTLTFLMLALGACSNGGGGQPAVAPATPTPAPTPTSVDVSGHFLYEYHTQSCTTGKHKFTSKKEYCDAHLNDSLNNNCAREMRIEGYNRACTVQQAGSLGTLPAMNSARCVVSGMDLKDRTFLENLNPFNPQRRQSFRDIFWDGKRAQTYNIMFSVLDSYGKVRFAMTPASSTAKAMGQIQLYQNKATDEFFASSGLGSSIRLIVTNYDMEKEVEAACLSDKSFKKPKVDLSQIRCSFGSAEASQKSPQREEVFSWDKKNLVEKEIFRSTGRESIVVRLKPATAQEEERIEIEALELDYSKKLKAESSLNEGLQVRYQSRDSREGLIVSCAPASK